MKIRDRIKGLRRVKTSELLPHPKNWRMHPQAQQDALRGVLAEIGWADAILVRETLDGLQIIDGHLRGDLAGDTEIPVLVLDVTEEEALKILATHDPLTSMAEASEKALGNLLAEIETENEAVQVMLDGLAEEHGVGPEPEPVEEVEPQLDRAVELQEKWGTELGQLWVVPSKTIEGREHRVLCGDSTKAEDVEWIMGGSVCDVVIADPPYGVEYQSRVDEKRHKGWGKIAGDDFEGEALRKLVVAAVPEATYRFVWCNWECYSLFVEALGKPRSVCVWVKECFGLGKGYRRQHEWCLFYGTLNRTDLSDVWRCNRASDYQHPVQKPVQKPVQLIGQMLRDVDATNVYDPFLGSGTTMVAAEQLGRLCYGIEIEPKYVAVILERMTDLGLDPQLAKGNATPSSAPSE